MIKKRLDDILFDGEKQSVKVVLGSDLGTSDGSNSFTSTNSASD